ncbi:MAG TPA: integrase, partial [Casimicrobiaceae bacterium]
MVIDMSEQKLVTLVQLRQFLDGTQEVGFRGCGNDRDRYQHIEAVVRRFGYRRLKRTDKGVIVRYLQRTTGYSR